MQQAEEIKELICIRCPLGCQLEVSLDDSGKVAEVAGHTCARGKEYATEEVSDPRRMVTSLVLVEGALEPLSVKTATPVPKAQVQDVLAAIRALRVQAPVALGEVLIEDVCGTGISVIATKRGGF